MGSINAGKPLSLKVIGLNAGKLLARRSLPRKDVTCLLAQKNFQGLLWMARTLCMSTTPKTRLRPLSR
jgi:hypothetical protein